MAAMRVVSGDEILHHGLEFGQESVPPRCQLFDQTVECVCDFRSDDIVHMELIDWCVCWQVCCHLSSFGILIEIIFNSTDTLLLYYLKILIDVNRC